MDDYRDTPIVLPAGSADNTALDYHQVEIDLNGEGNSEPLVDLALYKVAAHSAYASDDPPYHKAFANALATVFVRKSVAKKLVEVNDRLKKYGVEVFALDGFRPISLQTDIWNYFIKRGEEVLSEPKEEDLVQFAGTYCSDPRSFDPGNWRTWPVHNTGGAIDLTLRSLKDQKPLFMGSSFDQADEISATTYFENSSMQGEREIEARVNRRMLYHSMRQSGFVNYPHEWWHFDFGTQMWVKNGNKKPPAIYGRAELVK
ncbi:MAG: M15 family metallopeptidase [Candidatus Melainabacteria bacterium]|nr:M15 family metallopeptidase [Candidatus Melainabacteria bacterium]